MLGFRVSGCLSIRVITVDVEFLPQAEKPHWIWPPKNTPCTLSPRRSSGPYDEFIGWMHLSGLNLALRELAKP